MKIKKVSRETMNDLQVINKKTQLGSQLSFIFFSLSKVLLLLLELQHFLRIHHRFHQYDR